MIHPALPNVCGIFFMWDDSRFPIGSWKRIGMLDIRGRLDEWICTQPFQRVIREDYRFVPSVSSCRRNFFIRTACNGESFKDHRARQRWVSSHPSKDPRSCTTSYQFLLRFWSLLLHYHAIQNWRHIPVLVVWSYTVKLVPHLIYMHFSTVFVPHLS